MATRRASRRVFSIISSARLDTPELSRRARLALRALRSETTRKLNFSLRDLYRTLEEPGDNPLREAQARLDAAVRAAYDMADDVDPLAFLLDLNVACAAKEKAGEKVTPPGLPLAASDEQQAFVTDDCIRAPTL